MENHLDVHYADFPTQSPVIGEVTAIFPKDHANNQSGKVTLYQVKGLFQRPNMPVTLGDNVPFMGQSAGWGHESEHPLVVGQRCVVIFMEGDPQRPVILGAFPFVGAKSTPVAAQTSAEAPQERTIASGVDLTINKDGDVVLKLAPDRKLEVQDSAGAVLLEVEKSGGAYEVNLGGDTGLEKLIDDRARAVFNDHGHEYLIPPSAVPIITSKPTSNGLPVAVPVTNVPAVLTDPGHVTQITKGK